MPYLTSYARALGGAIAAFALCSSIALAQSDVSVTLNGAPLNLNPPPQERSGRVFVPLRGVFEQLGASVVYDNGTINAQKGHERSVSLHVGSTAATVDGQPQTLDVAPFIIGASTYVPLRFVSQALGASVNYDANNRVVALGESGRPMGDRPMGDRPMGGQPMGGPPPRSEQPQALQPPPPDHTSLILSAVRPGRNEVVPARRPTIEADFADGRVNPDSLRITLDGVNVTGQSTRSPRGIVYSPPSDLQSGRHEVHVNGTDTNGTPFDANWSFTSGRTVGDR